MEVNWHERFLQQSHWTKNIRDYLLKDISLNSDSLTLEVGCGTGVVLSDIANAHTGRFIGVDINFERCIMSTRNSDNLEIHNVDAVSLPYPAATFDLVVCHYFLLWLSNPIIAIGEIFRVLKSGGIFIAFAEPDYLNRIDSPRSLENLGEIQTQSLIRQGVNPGAGKDLPPHLISAGFRLLKFGLPGYEHPIQGIPDWWNSEWQVLEQDLFTYLTYDEIAEFKRINRASWISGNRVLWVPTYYALGRKP